MSLWLTVDDVIGLRVRDVITLGSTAADNLSGQHSTDVGAACRTHGELLILAGQSVRHLQYTHCSVLLHVSDVTGKTKMEMR